MQTMRKYVFVMVMLLQGCAAFPKRCYILTKRDEFTAIQGEMVIFTAERIDSEC